MHSLAWLASNGTAAIVCFPGIMYRGGAEQKIRKYLVDNNFIDCIIQLPSNLFFGTSIATCIMVLKKGKTDNKVLFIDASSECVKVTNNNKLTPENINKIVDTFAQRAEEAHFSHLAEYSEVQENDYNLSVSTYVEARDTREKIDIVKWSEDVSEFISAALSPAKVVKVELLPGETRSCRVTVPDQQLSLAIGNKGQNARLCARLTGYNIDIRPESGYYGEEEPKAAEAEKTEDTAAE